MLFSDLPTLSTDDTIGLHTLLVGFRAYPIFVYALFRMGSSENSLLPLQYGISKEVRLKQLFYLLDSLPRSISRSWSGCYISLQAAGSIFDLLDIFDMFEMGAILPEGSIRTCVLTFLILGVAVLQYDVSKNSLSYHGSMSMRYYLVVTVYFFVCFLGNGLF